MGYWKIAVEFCRHLEHLKKNPHVSFSIKIVLKSLTEYQTIQNEQYQKMWKLEIYKHN